MIRRARMGPRSGQVLILLLAAFLGGSSLLATGMFATGSSMKDIKGRIQDTIEDEARRERAVELLGKWEDESQGFEKQYAKLREELQAALQEHDATPADVDAVFRRLQAKNREVAARVIERRFTLKTTLTREEWARVFPK